MFQVKVKNSIYDQVIGAGRKPKRNPKRRGCNNGACFCSGACQEIVGWEWEEEQPIGQNPLTIKPFVQEEESHFEDIEDVITCNHPGHNPPTHLHIPQGKRYIHICPACKQKTILQPLRIRL